MTSREGGTENGFAEDHYGLGGRSVGIGKRLGVLALILRPQRPQAALQTLGMGCLRREASEQQLRRKVDTVGGRGIDDRPPDRLLGRVEV
jgi:hypothetical protein